MGSRIPPSQAVRGGQVRGPRGRSWWSSVNDATHYDVQRSDSEDGEYAIVATKVTTLGLVDEGLQPE